MIIIQATFLRHRFLFLGRLEDGPFTLSPPPREEVLTAIQAKVQGTGQRVKGRSRVQITSPNMKRHGVQRSYPMRMRSLRAISDSDLKLLSRSLGSTSHWVFYRSLHNSGDPGPENFRVEAIGGHLWKAFRSCSNFGPRIKSPLMRVMAICYQS